MWRTCAHPTSTSVVPEKQSALQQQTRNESSPATGALRSDHFNEGHQSTENTLLNELSSNVGSGKKEGVLAEALCVTKHVTIPEKWKEPIPFGQQPLVPFAKQTSLQLKRPTVEGLIDNVSSLEGLTTKLKEVVSSKIGYAVHLRRDVRSLRNETWRGCCAGSPKCPMKIIVQLWQSTTDATRCSFSVYENGTHQHDEVLSKRKWQNIKSAGLEEANQSFRAGFWSRQSAIESFAIASPKFRLRRGCDSFKNPDERSGGDFATRWVPVLPLLQVLRCHVSEWLLHIGRRNTKNVKVPTFSLSYHQRRSRLTTGTFFFLAQICCKSVTVEGVCALHRC